MFNKILVANRGEIAVRVIRACRDMGISPVAIYSEADRDALHVRLADEAYRIGPAPSSQSYLVPERILQAAKSSGAEAVHPGYGFLSENPDFASSCQEAGLVFIGPSASAIRLMGNKIAARNAMKQAGVPVIPGSDGPLASFDETRHAARETGYPLMIKASAGGGGKGLRIVSDEAQLKTSFEQARSEADASFGDPTVYIEKVVEGPRHIEIQILGDRFGKCVHLGERECSIQRRHQKVVEESPSPVVDASFRDRLGRAALKAAAAVDYYNAGTVEMLVGSPDRKGERPFYFLEMNTRLQVEHPVTELVSQVDLVREQIRIAAHEPLSFDQSDVLLRGTAIEFRVYAEDPFNQFFPSPGRIGTLSEPSGPGIRVDSGVYAGYEIPIHYDPLISKLVSFGPDRTVAIERMRRALKEYRIGGVRTNLPFFSRLVDNHDFLAGNLTTGFIQQQGLSELSHELVDEKIPLAAAAIEVLERSRRPVLDRKTHRVRSGPWKNSGRLGKRL